MLVLTRKVGQEILIGPPGEPLIRIMVTGVRHMSGSPDYRIKIGIDAPAYMPVHRAEVAERILRGEG